MRLFTPDEDAALLFLRDVESLQWSAIAETLGRPSGWCVNSRYLKLQAAVRRRIARGAERPCMRCREPMLSEHAGHRHCDGCRVALTKLDDGSLDE